MKMAGSHGSIAIVPRRNSRAAWPGLLPPGDHTCGWTTSTLHSRLAWRYWFRWGYGASSTTSFIADLAGATSPTRVLQAQITQRCTRYVAMHPLRRDAPDQKGCNAYGSGAPPHRRQACTRVASLAPPTPAPTGPGRAALHQIQQQCTR